MNELVVRKESKADRICTSNLAGDSPKGNLLCIDSTGDSTGCDVCMEHGSAKNGYSCYITTGSETELGRKTACPQDPAPKKNPDGSKSPSIAEDIVSAYCDVAGTGGAFGWLSYAGCFAWAFASEDDASAAEQAQNFAEGKRRSRFEGLIDANVV